MLVDGDLLVVVQGAESISYEDRSLPCRAIMETLSMFGM
jgi:hypothetical protein